MSPVNQPTVQSYQQALFFIITNSYDKTIKVPLFDPEFVDDAISIESEVKWVTYNEMLRGIIQYRVKITRGLFYFDEWIEGFEKKILVCTKDLFGTNVQIPIELKAVPFLGDKERTFEFKQSEFLIDCLTHINIWVPGARKLHIELYGEHFRERDHDKEVKIESGERGAIKIGKL